MTPTPGQILKAVRDDLAAWEPAKGNAALCRNVWELVERLKQAPNRWRITIHWQGDQAADPTARLGKVVNNTFLFIVDGNLGPTAKPGEGLVAGEPPLLDFLNQVRERVLSYTFSWLATPNNRFHYVGTDDSVALPDNMLVAAYAIKCTIFSPISKAATDVALTIPEPEEEEEEP
jgi:hypothetical protein